MSMPMPKPRTFDPLPRKFRGQLEARIQAAELELPMLEQVVQEIMQLCNDPATDAVQIAEALQSDQSMAGNVLKVANSPLYRARSEINSLQDAVARLGMQQVTAIALMVSTKSNVFRSKRYLDLVEYLWKHALATGCFARELAKMLAGDGETAFLCGLFHDVGSPIVLDVAAAIEASSNFQVSQRQAQAAMQEFSTPLGLRLAKAWNLPEPVVDAIENGADSIALASHAARSMLEGTGTEEMLAGLVELPVTAELGLDEDRIRTFLANAERILAAVQTLD